MSSFVPPRAQRIRGCSELTVCHVTARLHDGFWGAQETTPPALCLTVAAGLRGPHGIRRRLPPLCLHLETQPHTDLAGSVAGILCGLQACGLAEAAWRGDVHTGRSEIGMVGKVCERSL